MKAVAFLQVFFHVFLHDPSNQTDVWKDDVLVALIYGTLSAVTLPLGAAVGCFWVDASETLIAFMVAFGAGALLFAVTVELYGEAVDRLEEHGFLSGVGEMSATGIGALLGAIIYILCCRWIDKAVETAQTQSSPNESPHGTSSGGNRYERGTGPRMDPSPHDPIPPGYSDKEMTGVRGRKRAVMGVLDPSLHQRYKYSKEDDDEDPPIRYGATASASVERSPRHLTGRPTAAAACCEEKKFHEIRVAIFIWLGALLDGIPEAIMLGYLAAEAKLSLALVVALFVSNFPESFSSAVLLVKHGIARWKVIVMWGALCVFTGVVASVTAWLLPDAMLSRRGRYREDYWHLKLMGALIEGMAGGAMLACISNVMLPDAFKRRGDMVGMFVMLGFIMAVSVKVFGGVVDELYFDH